MNEKLFDAAKLLFTSSECLRQVLDDIDIEGLPVSDETTKELGRIMNYLERTAQRLQKASKN